MIKCAVQERCESAFNKKKTNTNTKTKTKKDAVLLNEKDDKICLAKKKKREILRFKAY